MKGWEKGELVFKEYRLSVGEDENILEMDGGDGYRTMQIYINATEL